MGQNLVSVSSCLIRLLVAALTLALPLAVPGLAVHAQQSARAAITYNDASDTIEVRGPGAVVTLSEIYDELGDGGLLEKLSPFEWELKANLMTFEQVRLELHGAAAGGDVNWLKLRSDPTGFVSVESESGQISIRSAKITSWDRGTGDFDTAFLDGSGRAFIAAHNFHADITGNRMDVIDSEIAYLGYSASTSYGISWKVESEGKGNGILGEGLTGTVTGSRFHHNYFGAYFFGVGGMEFRNNEFFESHVYGLDGHDFSRGVLIENNNAHDNDGHGIIVSVFCTGNIFRNNRSENNGGHGIMLHEFSDNNVVEGNHVIGNAMVGIPLFDSSNNYVAGNEVKDNAIGVRVYGPSESSMENVFEKNEISGNSFYGVFLYDAATRNIFRTNEIVSNGRAGIYLRGAFDNLFTGNTIRNNEHGIRLDAADVDILSTGNRFLENTIENNRIYGFYSYPLPEANIFEGNRVSGNGRQDINYVPSATEAQNGGITTILGMPLLLGFVLGVTAAGTALLVYRRARH